MFWDTRIEYTAHGNWLILPAWIKGAREHTYVSYHSFKHIHTLLLRRAYAMQMLHATSNGKLNVLVADGKHIYHCQDNEISRYFHSKKFVVNTHTHTLVSTTTGMQATAFGKSCWMLLSKHTFYNQHIELNDVYCAWMVEWWCWHMLLKYMCDSPRMSFTIHVLIQFPLHRETNKLTLISKKKNKIYHFLVEHWTNSVISISSKLDRTFKNSLIYRN